MLFVMYLNISDGLDYPSKQIIFLYSSIIITFFVKRNKILGQFLLIKLSIVLNAWFVMKNLRYYDIS